MGGITDARTGGAVSAATPDVAAVWAADVRPGWLRRHNPLATLAAPLPAMLALVVVHDTRAALVLTAVAVLALVTGAGLGRRGLLALLVAAPLGTVALGAALGLWVAVPDDDAGRVLLQVGPVEYTSAGLAAGLATAARLAAVAVLALVGGLTSSGPDLARALQQQLRVPYRVTWTILAAFRFVPRLGHEVAVIRAAHRVRGGDEGPGPVATVRRWVGWSVPLLAGGLRHAERTAYAMDARGFGAHPTRTERHRVPWRTRDTALVVAGWTLTAAVLLVP